MQNSLSGVQEHNIIRIDNEVVNWIDYVSAWQHLALPSGAKQ